MCIYIKNIISCCILRNRCVSKAFATGRGRGGACGQGRGRIHHHHNNNNTRQTMTRNMPAALCRGGVENPPRPPGAGRRFPSLLLRHAKRRVNPRRRHHYGTPSYARARVVCMGEAESATDAATRHMTTTVCVYTCVRKHAYTLIRIRTRVHALAHSAVC